MPAHVAVVTDSTACLPQELATRWDIAVVQVQLHVGNRVEEEHRFDRARLIDELRSGGRVSTSPPDPGAFFWTYQQAAASGASEVVSVHVSGRMSATVQAARDAARKVRIPVHVLDSRTTGMSLGFAALSAARAAGAGAQTRRVIHAAEARYRTSTELIYVDTLEYLRRDRRIGAATAMLGSAFSIKPVLTVVDGEVAPVAKAAGSKRALDKVVDLAVSRAAGRAVDVAVTQFGADENRVDDLAVQLGARLPAAKESVVGDASTIIGAHVGPGALGVTVSPAF